MRYLIGIILECNLNRVIILVEDNHNNPTVRSLECNRHLSGRANGWTRKREEPIQAASRTQQRDGPLQMPGNAGPSGSSDSVIIRRMWEGGPLRQIADTKVSPVYRAYVYGGSRCTFAGRYVCDGCIEPAIGVYRQKRSGLWVCGGCRG